MTLPWSKFYDGHQQASCLTRSFTIGPWSFQYSNGDLLYLCYDGIEIVRRIYGALRDTAWETIKPTIADEIIEESVDTVRIGFIAKIGNNEVNFDWHGKILARGDGSFCFDFDGTATSDFDCNRVGLCLLHTVDHVVGKACRFLDGDRREKVFHFTSQIAPQNFATNIASMCYAFDGSSDVEIDFHGELFEIEDQRNWIDDSFKTFCRPLSLPCPIQVRNEERVRQSIEISVLPHLNQSHTQTLSEASNVCNIRVAPRPNAHVLTIGSELPHQMHRVGIVWNAKNSDVDECSWLKLKAMKLEHIRFDIGGSVDSPLREPLPFRSLRQNSIEQRQTQQDESMWIEQIHSAHAVAKRLETKLEIAIHIPTAKSFEQADFWKTISSHSASMARILLFSSEAWNTKADLAEAWSVSRPQDWTIPVFVGTRANFTELNRDRSMLQFGHGICYSVQPQEHAYDNLSLVETTKVIGQTIASVQSFAPGKAIAISPLTLRKRVNPYGSTPEELDDAADGLPRTVDPRQMSLLGAGWTLGCLKYLSESGAESSTWYEPIGWKGLMESPRGSKNASMFPSSPGMLFPIYHVLREWCSWSHSVPLSVVSSDRLSVDAAACRDAGGIRVLMANLKPIPAEVIIEGFHTVSHPIELHTRYLDSYSILDFDSTLSEGNATSLHEDSVRLKLNPFSILFARFLEVHHATH